MSKGLIKKEETALAMPSFLDSVSSKEGMETLPEGTFDIPRLELLQDSTKDVKKKLATAGTYRNSITKEEFGTNVELILLKVSSGAVYMTMKEGFKCKSIDGKTNVINGGQCSNCWLSSYYANWVDGKAPTCTATFDFVVVERKSLQSGIPNIMALSFRRSAYKMAKQKIISRARALGKPLYAQAYNLGCEFVDHPMGGYNSFTIDYNGWINEEEFGKVKELYEMFKDREFNISEDSADSSDAPIETSSEETPF